MLAGGAAADLLVVLRAAAAGCHDHRRFQHVAHPLGQHQKSRTDVIFALLRVLRALAGELVIREVRTRIFAHP